MGISETGGDKRRPRLKLTAIVDTLTEKQNKHAGGGIGGVGDGSPAR
jgi:hypothetical protein